MNREGSSKRPLAVVIWALIFVIGGALDLFNAYISYVAKDQDFAALNPGLFAYLRPIAWVTAIILPLGMWFRRWWAVALYLFMQLAAVALIYIEKPFWADTLPTWGIPLALIAPALFLATVLPYWRRLSGRIP